MCCLKCKVFLRILIFLFSETNSVSHFIEFDKLLLGKLFYGTSLGDGFWNKLRKSNSIMSEEYFYILCQTNTEDTCEEFN